MNPQPAPQKIPLSNPPDYREAYANSVQVRVSLWDFFLLFGTINQTAPDSVTIQNFEGIFLSPQQAKALVNVLNQNVRHTNPRSVRSNSRRTRRARWFSKIACRRRRPLWSFCFWRLRR